VATGAFGVDGVEKSVGAGAGAGQWLRLLVGALCGLLEPVDEARAAVEDRAGLGPRCDGLSAATARARIGGMTDVREAGARS